MTPLTFFLALQWRIEDQKNLKSSFMLFCLAKEKIFIGKMHEKTFCLKSYFLFNFNINILTYSFSDSRRWSLLNLDELGFLFYGWNGFCDFLWFSRSFQLSTLLRYQTQSRPCFDTVAERKHWILKKNSL